MSKSQALGALSIIQARRFRIAEMLVALRAEELDLEITERVMATFDKAETSQQLAQLELFQS